MNNIKSVFLLLILISNCAAFNFGDTNSSIEYAKGSERVNRPTATLEISYDYQLNRKKIDRSSEDPAEDPRVITKNIYNEFNFLNFQHNSTLPDYIIQVDISERAHVSRALTMLSGLSFGLLPSWVRTDVKMKTTLLTGNRKLLGEIYASGDSLMIMQLIMILPMPFFYPFSQYENLFIGLNRYSINEAIRRGIISY